MTKCLKESGFIPPDTKTDAELAWLDHQLQEIITAISRERDGINDLFKIVYACLNRHIFRIARYVKRTSHPEIMCFSYTDWTKQYTADMMTSGTRHLLVDRLLNLVIPDVFEHDDDCESESADLASILNAGWAVYYHQTYWNTFCARLDSGDLAKRYNARHKLFNLLLKGIESSYLKQQWEQYLQ